MIIKNENIAGYRFENEISCMECVTEKEIGEATKDEIITSQQIEDSEETYFCDRCGKQL